MLYLVFSYFLLPIKFPRIGEGKGLVYIVFFIALAWLSGVVGLELLVGIAA